MVLISKQEEDIDIDTVREDLNELERVNEQEVKPLKNKIRQELKSEEITDVAKWLNTQYGNELDIIKTISQSQGINLTEAQDYIIKYPEQPIIADKTIPNLVKEMKDLRRQFKGDQKAQITKGIGHLITAYEHYIQKCVESIYWVTPYQSAMNIIGLSEKNLQKMYHIKDEDRRTQIVESLCKMWEAKLDRDCLSYGKEYSELTKTINSCKKEVRAVLKEISHQTIRKSKKEMIYDCVKEIICDNPGLTANAIHSHLPETYNKISTPQSISKMLRKMKATKVDSEYYLISDEIKKDLYSYVAGFIDSDGYITMDSSFAPRVGMIATGNRGRAFFQELESELKCGRLHLDQKAGENNRSQHRLNFYSQADISTILEKCLPHLRMKKRQGELLTEAIRIKQRHKKTDWAKPRLEEIFKLIKYENWKDARNKTEWEKYGIDPEVVVKYNENSKMALMDELESGVQ